MMKPKGELMRTDLRTIYDMEDMDFQNRGIPEEVAPYAKSIFKELRSNEGQYTPSAGYMTRQSDINEKMRAILVDWLVDVHLKFKLVNETLFLAVNLIDRYLEKSEVSRQKLQLVGITAMFIASKYEEIYPPDLRDFVYVTDKAYTKSQILNMEGQILKALNFNVTVTSSYLFLQRFAKLLNMNEKAYMMARYLLELSLVEYSFLKYTPSNIAASAAYLAAKIFKMKTTWNQLVAECSQYTETDVRSCAKKLCELITKGKASSLDAVKRKFTHKKFYEVG
jgi:transcription initiation factor TFIIIB Brf1 subunit/transcription initiation factor TFIIB